MTRRQAQYKPLLFTTTVRNPQRVKSLLHILAKFNKKILTNELCITICKDLCRYGLYRPMNKTNTVKDKWSSTKQGTFSEIVLTDLEVENLIDSNPQNHKEAGYDTGWPSRFSTIFDFTKELGFVYFETNKKIEFSEIGLRLSNVYKTNINNEYIIVTEEHPEFEEQAFLHSMAKYQRNNPFVRVLNDNVPLILLLQVIKLLNNDSEFNRTGIAKHELPFIIYWKDNNAQSLYNLIKTVRRKYSYNPSWEVITDICRNEIMEGKDISREDKSIMAEYPDEFIRKMRITGLISLRGGGRFIDINKNQIKKVNYILETYSTYPKFQTEKEYFNYMSLKDDELINIESKSITIEENNNFLDKWINYYNWDTIKKELIQTSKRRNSTDDILKYLTHPIKLEFLTSLAIKSKFPNIKISPNYPCDDEGIPTSTAPGINDMGDIECIENDKGILIEVTMAGGRVQTMMEIWPITRHMEALSEKIEKETMCHFVSPTIFVDSEKQIKFVHLDEGKFIKAHTVENFIKYLETEQTLYQNDIQ